MPKRKPREWERWARVVGDEVSVIHPDVPVESAQRLYALIGDDGECIRVRVVEVLPPSKRGSNA